MLVTRLGIHQRAVWEDVTDTTPLTIFQGYARFTTLVSASFWMVYCPNWMSSDLLRVIDTIYKVSLSIYSKITTSTFPRNKARASLE